MPPPAPSLCAQGWGLDLGWGPSRPASRWWGLRFHWGIPSVGLQPVYWEHLLTRTLSAVWMFWKTRKPPQMVLGTHAPGAVHIWPSEQLCNASVAGEMVETLPPPLHRISRAPGQSGVHRLLFNSCLQQLAWQLHARAKDQLRWRKPLSYSKAAEQPWEPALCACNPILDFLVHPLHHPIALRVEGSGGGLLDVELMTTQELGVDWLYIFHNNVSAEFPYNYLGDFLLSTVHARSFPQYRILAVTK
jgi:hypothetical protein